MGTPAVVGKALAVKMGTIESSRSSVNSNASESSVVLSQLDRLPSPVRKLLEMKARAATGEPYHAEEPKEKPKYWDNKPKVDPNAPKVNPLHQMAQMRQEAKQHKLKMKEEQEAILKSAVNDPEEPWYNDEPEELQKALAGYEHRPSDHHRNASDKRTPEENMAVIKLYGGIQWPGGVLKENPKRLMKKILGRSKRRKIEGAGGQGGGGAMLTPSSGSTRDSGIESQPVSPRPPSQFLSNCKVYFFELSSFECIACSCFHPSPTF